MSASVLSVIASTALAQSQPAAKPESAPTAVTGITVEGASKPKVIQQQAHSFVQSYAAVPNAEVDQIARWHDPVCVQTVGLPDDQSAIIKARIDNVAVAVGLPKARAGCLANVEIVFTEQPQAIMDNVAKRREQLLGYYHRHDRDRLKTVTHPIQAWYVTATLGGGGSDAAAFYGLSGMQSSKDVVDDPDNPPPTSCGDNPHFGVCLTSVLRNVFMVVDTKALKGKDLGLLSDYIVMLTLSQPKSLDVCGSLTSVIDLLAKSCTAGRDVPDGLTPGDAAYLTALYSADLEATKAKEQNDIAVRMAKILVKASATGR